MYLYMHMKCLMKRLNENLLFNGKCFESKSVGVKFGVQEAQKDNLKKLS